MTGQTVVLVGAAWVTRVAEVRVAVGQTSRPFKPTSPLELMDAGQLEEGSEGEVEVVDFDESGGVVIDGELVAGDQVECLPPPGFSVPWYERYADEFAIIILAIGAALVRRFDLRDLKARTDPITTPLPPDEARGILAAQLVAAEREIAARDRRIALMAEGERRATQQARQEVARTRPRSGLRDEELIASMEAIGQAASAPI